MLEKKSPVVTEYIQERIDTLFTIFPITPMRDYIESTR